jgi:hypothetical protein
MKKNTAIHLKNFSEELNMYRNIGYQPENEWKAEQEKADRQMVGAAIAAAIALPTLFMAAANAPSDVSENKRVSAVETGLYHPDTSGIVTASQAGKANIRMPL